MHLAEFRQLSSCMCSETSMHIASQDVWFMRFQEQIQVLVHLAWPWLQNVIVDCNVFKNGQDEEMMWMNSVCLNWTCALYAQSVQHRDTLAYRTTVSMIGSRNLADPVPCRQ